MSNYYNMRDAKVRIAHELMNRGWEVKGYHADESDSMTDYYSPAYWNGIATKNGYILVVDNSTGAEAKEITKYNPKGNLSFEDRNKIEKLEVMTIDRGCTAGEEENAKALIERIKEKTSTEPAYEVIGMSLAHMGNPSTSKWHIEKDGKIYDKGTGLTKYADMPSEWQYDINKMEFKNGYKSYSDYNNERYERTITDEQRKVINDFKALILRFERTINNMNGCGDGTAETEKAGAEQQQKEGYEKVTKTEYKTEIKVNEISKPENIVEGMYFILKTSFTNGCSKGNVYKINSVKQNPYNNKYYVDANRMNGKLNKTLTGRATAANSFNTELDRLINWIDKNSIAICELTEVQTPYTVEKWEKINKTAKTNTSKKESKTTEATEQPITEDKEQTNTNTPESNKINYTITEDIDTRDNSPLWVVKIIDKLNNEEYKKVSGQFKVLKGYYSKFKHGFIFKYNPSEALKGYTTKSEQTAEEVHQDTKQTTNNTITADQQTTTETKDPYKQQEIEQGYLYNCHFKQWNLSITDIQSYLKVFEVPYIDMGNKFGFEGLTADKAIEAKAVSDINGSIFFIDTKTPITADNNQTEEQPEQEAETDNIIDLNQYKEENKNNNEGEEVKNNYNSNASEVDDIFNTFDNIEINNNSRISADDEEFCITEQEQYNKALDTLTKIKNLIQDDLNIDITADRPINTQKTNNKYLEYYDFRSITELFKGKKDSFTHRIIGHFTNKYKITIDSYKVIEKYKNKEINYNVLLDEIFLQLDGFSFADKSVKELKDETRKIYHYNDYRKSSNMSIKNNRVVIDGYYAYKDWDVYRIRGNFDKVFTALYHFENGSISEDKTELHNKYCGYANEKNQSNFEKYEPSTLTKVTGIKFFKNGKLEIEFKSNQNATYFAKDYLGYTEQSAKAV